MTTSTRKPERSRLMIGLAALAFLVAGAWVLAGDGPSESWTQFGGPEQDFRAKASGLSASWGDEGPPERWRRDLGDGYSGILVEAGKLYTMYRDGDEEAVISLDAKSGKTLWEHRYEQSPREGHVEQFGTGPRATPLISGDRIYTIGVAGMMHCLNKTNGKVLWSHDLWGDEFGGNFLNHGYSSSPIEYKNTIIALVGGEDASIVAFNKKSGKIEWKSLSFENSYSTPQVFDVGGKPQLITFMAKEIVGVDPDSGKLEWSYPIENQWGQNINMPVLIDGKYLFLSSLQAGARGLELKRGSDGVEVEEIWSTRKIQFYHVTSVLDGDWVYGSTGSMGPTFIAAINARTGEIAWRERGFSKANCTYADGKLFILDEDGNLAITTATPEGLDIHAKAQILEKAAWTVPTIVGKTLYARDKATIVALDLG